MDSAIIKQLIDICGIENVRADEPLSKHTSFRIGGPCDVFASPGNAEELEQVITLCDENNIPRFILGNGTNVLAADEGYRGVVINVYKRFCDIEVQGKLIKAGAGALLSLIAGSALKNDLTGFEFAAGIPGTLGGAVTMNAGAYGGEMKDVLVCADVYIKGTGVLTLSNQELKLGYRDSVIKHEDMVVLNAVLKLEKGEHVLIKERMNELKEARTSKQPLDYPSAGSTFKRPEGYFAGKLIQDAGLKGYTVGGAQVSEKHSGFVINIGGATAKDVKDLMDHVVKTVDEKFGVILEPEVLLLG